MNKRAKRAKKVISTRLDPDNIAKARDGLKLKGYETEQLANVSNVVRLTFLHGLVNLLTNAKALPSPESLNWINQKINQKQSKTNLSLEDIIK